VEPKGLHLAIEAVRSHNKTSSEKIRLKIAGKHYAGYKKDKYWTDIILPKLDVPYIEYVGFLKTTSEKNEFLANAKALIIPSIYEEPFGMVMIEALACGTPIIGISSGAIPEIINTHNGILVKKDTETITIKNLAAAINGIDEIDRKSCRQDFEQRFTSARMAKNHLKAYRRLTTK
jgi:glycosyltransferase involved in cell wall biosynthesis